MRAPGAAGPPRTCQVQAVPVVDARCTVNAIYQIPGIHVVHSLVRDLHMYEQSRTVGQHSKRTAGSCFACSAAFVVNPWGSFAPIIGAVGAVPGTAVYQYVYQAWHGEGVSFTFCCCRAKESTGRVFFLPAGYTW